MRTNKIVWGGLAALVLAVGVVVTNKLNENKAEETRTAGVAPKPDQSHLKVLPNKVEGDTVVETITTVQAQNEDLSDQFKLVNQQNIALKKRLDALERSQGRSASGENPIDSIVGKVSDMTSYVETLSKQFEQQQELFETTSANGYSFSKDDLGWGEQTPSRSNSTYRTGSNNPNNTVTQSKKLSGYVSVVPMVAKTPKSRISSVQQTAKKRKLTSLNKTSSKVQPFYTIPARSTLLDNVSMTTLVGRVPIGDKLKSPFPAKIIVGNDNLATNGIRIPNLKGIVFEGVASGNWNLSCVSVHLTAATFTFSDGTIQHLYGQKNNSTKGKNSASLSPVSGEMFDGSIGYVSDPKGIPCVPGKRITDAHKQIAAISLLGMGVGYFDAKANSEVSTNLDTDDGFSAVTGDSMKYAFNSAKSDAAKSALDFYKDRNRDTFDAIVAPPATKLVIHLSTDLNIDYDPDARKVVYNRSSIAGSAYHALD